MTIGNLYTSCSLGTEKTMLKNDRDYSLPDAKRYFDVKFLATNERALQIDSLEPAHLKAGESRDP